MATRIQQIQQLQSAAFQQQVAGSLLVAAIAVLNEDSATEWHPARLALARMIMQNAQGQAQMLLPWMMGNSTILNGAGGAVNPASGTPYADSDVDTVVQSLYNTLAGV